MQKTWRADLPITFFAFFSKLNICIEDKRPGYSAVRGDRRRLVAVQQRLAQQVGRPPALPAQDGDVASYLALVGGVRRTSAAAAAAAVAPASELDVPSEFFEAPFCLHERNTFDYCNGVQIVTLSRWLDQVESRLLLRLAERARELFVALARVAELRELTQQSATQARTLEAVVRAMRAREQTVRVLRLHVRRERARRVERQLSLLAELRHAGPMVELLLASDDYAAALDLVDTAVRVIDSELGGVQALAATRARLALAAADIDARMRRQFLEQLCFGADDEPAAQAPLVLVLARSGRLDAALHAYAEAAAARHEQLVDAAWARAPLLDDAAFGDALARGVQLLAAAAERARAVHVVIDGAARGAANDAALAAVRESAAALVARALAARGERLRHAPVGEFARVHELAAQLCVRLGGAPARTLLAALATQARAFVDAFHASRRASLQLLLESELWAPTAVPPPSWLAAAASSSGSGGDATRLYVGAERTFLCTNVVLLLLGMLDAYVQCADALPALAGELAARATQLVKQFNEQTCALVLGAGAVQLLRLKTVTARHLALAQQSVELVLALLPDVRRRLLAPLDAPRAALAAPPLVALERDLGAHVAQIDAKFAALLHERVALYAAGQLPLDALADDAAALVKVLTRCLDEHARRRALAAVASTVRPLLRSDDPFGNVLQEFESEK